MKPVIPYRYIAIEGNIGSGKSTLAHLLSNQLNARLILEEFEDNSFLPKFYNDPRRFAFPLEMSFLASRFNQLKTQLQELDLFREYVISDYIFAKCLLFSKVNLNDDEYDLYYRLFNIIDLQLPKPDLLIYLHCPIEKLQWNIANRGREYEQKIEDKYLMDLQQAYFSYLHGNPELRVVVIDCSNLDFLNNIAHYEQILDLLAKPYTPGMHHYHLLDF